MGSRLGEMVRGLSESEWVRGLGNRLAAWEMGSRPEGMGSRPEKNETGKACPDLKS